MTPYNRQQIIREAEQSTADYFYDMDFVKRKRNHIMETLRTLKGQKEEIQKQITELTHAYGQYT